MMRSCRFTSDYIKLRPLKVQSEWKNHLSCLFLCRVGYSCLIELLWKTLQRRRRLIEKQLNSYNSLLQRELRWEWRMREMETEELDIYFVWKENPCDVSRHTRETTEPAALKQMANKINFLSISGFAASIFRDIKVRAIEFRRSVRLWEFFSIWICRESSVSGEGSVRN